MVGNKTHRSHALRHCH